jgi:asparagine synthase (glutamine-hydrolysing)
MCGFVSYLCNLHPLENLRSRVVRACRLIEHRGPDDEAFYFTPEYCAGFRRLSIIDLSDAGRQPMADASGRFWVVFNGEIYNYKEVRSELIQLGHAFRTTGDTEVLLTAYMRWGQDCLSKVNGMFAFLIWDSVEKTLFGARDRFGEKPLFYSKSNKGIAFASEIKGIVPLIDQPVRYNESILADYLVEGKMDHSNETFFQGIQSVPAGHQLLVKDGQMKISAYWSLDTSESAFAGNSDDAVARFLELFQDSIRLRLRSDVPIGTCLSGGMDSSAIVCMIAKMLGSENFATATRKTFTAHYQEFDETQQLDDVVRQAHCESFRISPKPENLASLKELLWYQDEPFMSYSVFASREVMRKAKQENVKVLVNGQGSDEVLAGYSKFLLAYLRDLFRLGHFRALVHATQNERQFTGRNSLQSLLGIAREESKRWVRRLAGAMGAKERLIRRDRYNDQALVTQDFLLKQPALEFRTNVHESSKAGNLKGWLLRSMFVDNLPLYLRVEDRNSMSFSLESRLPFLDHRIAEFVLGLPTEWLMKDGKNKWLLRQAMSDLVPSSVVQRKNKYGFPIPDAVWLTGYLRSEVEELIRSDALASRGIFDPARILRLFLSIPTNIAGNPKDLQPKVRTMFRIISAELWIQELAVYESHRSRKYSEEILPSHVVQDTFASTTA